MPKVDNTPKTLQPYLFHGVDLDWSDTGKEATGQCPFCGREKKFSVDIESGLYRCLVCGEGTDKLGGNIYVFLRKLWELCDKAATMQDYQELANHRSLIHPETVMEWGICKSTVTGEWLVPGYAPNGNLNQLYKYAEAGGKWVLFPTPTLGHCLFGVDLYDASKPTVHICEGPWDALAWYEVLRAAKFGDSGLALTSNVEASLYSEVNIIAVPGCSTFLEPWTLSNLFHGKNVVLLYDSDHPRAHPNPKIKKLQPPVGHFYAQRAIELLKRRSQPMSISILHWGDKGYDPNLPSGTDVRDLLKMCGNALGLRLRGLQSILGKIALVVEPPVTGQKIPQTVGNGHLDLIHCESYRELIGVWRKAMKWTEGLDHGFAMMLASIISTSTVGDQLWIKPMGPASCGKTTLAEALATADKYVKIKDTIRGFTSGYVMPNGDSVDLLSELDRMTLITTDGDTLLKSVNLDNILAEGRRVYDGSLKSHFKNGSGKDIEGHRMTWILCGTASLRSIDSSELGERFLDVVVMDSIDDDLEDEILWRVANRAMRNVATEMTDDASTQADPDIVTARQMTGGYVTYLRENAAEIISQVEMSDDAMRYCTRLGKFVAYLRARPNEKQDEKAEREFAARLVSQHVRAARCLAAVLNKKSVDTEVMQRVHQVCLDTSRGKSLDIVRYLYPLGQLGALSDAIAQKTQIDMGKVGKIMKFMRHIGIVDFFEPPLAPNGTQPKARYRLTRRLQKLYAEVYLEEPADG